MESCAVGVPAAHLKNSESVLRFRDSHSGSHFHLRRAARFGARLELLRDRDTIGWAHSDATTQKKRYSSAAARLAALGLLRAEHPEVLFQAFDDFDQDVFADLVGAVEAVNAGPAARGDCSELIGDAHEHFFVGNGPFGQ